MVCGCFFFFFGPCQFLEGALLGVPLLGISGYLFYINEIILTFSPSSDITFQKFSKKYIKLSFKYHLL